MIEKEFIIKNKNGLHARPAALFVKTSGKFKSEIFVSKDGVEVNGKSILGVMTLAAEPGSIISVRIEGVDEEAAIQAIEDLIESGFNED
jgi:phosphocarrier protein HPr